MVLRGDLWQSHVDGMEGSRCGGARSVQDGQGKGEIGKARRGKEGPFKITTGDLEWGTPVRDRVN